jgi:predicted nucleic acid-binding protein
MDGSSPNWSRQRRVVNDAGIGGTNYWRQGLCARPWRRAIPLRIGRISDCRAVRPPNSSTRIVANVKPAADRSRSAAARGSRTGGAATTQVKYVESSALVAALLEHDTDVTKRLPAGARRVTSALTLSEVGRAIIRARTTGRLTADDEKAAVRALRTVERRCFVLDVNQAVLDRVRRPFPVEPIRTLDAIHLATAELLGEPPQLVTIVTRDERVRSNARALGYAVE